MFRWEDREEACSEEYVSIQKEIEEVGVPLAKYEKRLMDSAGRTWTSYFKVWEYPFVYRWLQSIGTGLKVMDFGCGQTPFAEFLSRKGYEVWGVDQDFLGSPTQLSEEVLKQAYPLVNYHIGNVHQMPERDFDAIISCSVLEHIRPDASLFEIARHLRGLLKPGGKMLHIVDYYFPKKKGRAHARINFYGLAEAMGVGVEDQIICPGSESFSFEDVKKQVSFVLPKLLESRIAIGDDK